MCVDSVNNRKVCDIAVGMIISKFSLKKRVIVAVLDPIVLSVLSSMQRPPEETRSPPKSMARAHRLLKNFLVACPSASSHHSLSHFNPTLLHRL